MLFKSFSVGGTSRTTFWATRLFRNGTMLFLILFLGLMVGCMNRYTITLTNGHKITSKGRPKLNEERSIYEYKNAMGERTSIPMIRVREIEPVPWPPPKDPATQLQEMHQTKD